MSTPWSKNEAGLRPSARPSGEALRVAAVYLLLSAAWIFFSDTLLSLFVSDGKLFARFSVVKGTVFITLSAGLIYMLVLRSAQRQLLHERAASAKLEAKAEEYRRLFATNPQPMWVYELDTLQIIEVNDAAVHLYGYSREEFLHRKITDMRPAEEVPRLLETIRQPLPAYRQTRNWRHTKKNGEVFDVEVSSHEVTLSKKKARIVLIMDVTERLRAERALADYRQQLEQRVAERTRDLREANDQLHSEVRERQFAERQLRHAHERAEAANQSKSRFIANTTHEIRTPLTSILGFAELLDDLARERHESSDEQNYTRIIRQEAQHLLGVLDDLLDISRIDAGQLRIELANVNVRQAVAEVVDLFRPRALAKNLQLASAIHADAPVEITTDPTRLRQVLINLVSNAIKYTEAGEITVEVTPTPRCPFTKEQHTTTSPCCQSEQPRVLFSVRDTGIGLSPDHLENVFQPFFQAHADLRHTGVGLGLSIARSLATMLGGAICVQSEPGRGSNFTLCLPACKTANVTTDVPEASTPVLQGRILLVDDHANIRQLVSTYLERAGAQVLTMSNAREAIELILSERSDTIDLLLMDMQMPDLDGETAVRQLRAAGCKKPIIALTAHSAGQEQQRWLDAGCTAVATKPIDRDKFLPLIITLLPH